MSDSVQVRLREPVRAVRVARTRSADAPAEPGHSLDALLERQQREAEVAEIQVRTLAAIERACSGVETAMSARLDEFAGQIVELALAVAEGAVGAAVRDGMVDAESAVRRCLAEVVAGPGEPVIVSCHPADLESLRVDWSTLGMPVERRSDPTVPRGGARVETAHGVIEDHPTRVFERLAARIRETWKA